MPRRLDTLVSPVLRPVVILDRGGARARGRQWCRAPPLAAAAVVGSRAARGRAGGSGFGHAVMTACSAAPRRRVSHANRAVHRARWRRRWRGGRAGAPGIRTPPTTARRACRAGGGRWGRAARRSHGSWEHRWSGRTGWRPAIAGGCASRAPIAAPRPACCCAQAMTTIAAAAVAICIAGAWPAAAPRGGGHWSGCKPGATCPRPRRWRRPRRQRPPWRCPRGHAHRRRWCPIAVLPHRCRAGDAASLPAATRALSASAWRCGAPPAGWP